MDSKVNYAAVGLFVIALVAVLIGVFIWLTTIRLKEGTRTYVTYLRDEVSGLSPRSAVRFNGVKVGYVDSIRLNPQDPQQVIVTMEIEKNAPMTTSTVSVLMSEGITGIDYIGLKALTPAAPLLTARKGEKYPVIPSQPSLLMKMSTAVQKVTVSISTLSKDIRKIFDEQNRTAVKNSLQNIEKITHAIAINSQNINEALQASNKVLQNSATASQQLPKIMQKINATLNQITVAAKSIAQAGNGVSRTMQVSSKAVQNVSHQLIPTAQQLLQNLDNLAGSLVQVSRELKLNPAILVRGKALPAPGPGERR